MSRRRQRMIFVSLLVAGVAAAVGLVIAAMGENMLYFYSPTQIRAGEAPSGPSIRVGGPGRRRKRTAQPGAGGLVHPD